MRPCALLAILGWAALASAASPPHVLAPSLERAKVEKGEAKPKEAHAFRLGDKDHYGCKASCAANQGVCMPTGEAGSQLQLGEGMLLQTGEAPAPKPAAPQLFGVRPP